MIEFIGNWCSINTVTKSKGNSLEPFESSCVSTGVVFHDEFLILVHLIKTCSVKLLISRKR